MPRLTSAAVDPRHPHPKAALVFERGGDACISQANGLLAGDDLPVFSGGAGDNDDIDDAYYGINYLRGDI